MATIKTKDEKLIANYETNGLSMSEWCNINGVSKSTLAGWIRGKKDDITKLKGKTKFVEVTIPAELQIQPEPQTKNTT